MKIFSILMLGIILGFGCARVRVEAPKEPIKVDVSMRLDIYQHVAKDIEAIESIVSGSKEKDKAADKRSMLEFFISNAYAQEGLGPEIEQAALRRRDRLSELNSWQAKGVIGESKSGLVKVILPEKADSKVNELAEAENNDRMIIYESVAKKNGTSVEDVQRIYARRLQREAPLGTPVENLDNNRGTSVWYIK